MAFLHHQYRCPDCQDEVVEKTYACPKCGPEGVLVYKRTGVGAFSSLMCHCGYVKPHRIPPSVCPNCKVPGCAWWDTDKSNWASLGQTPPMPKDGVWVTGEFDGDYLARQELAQSSLQLSSKVYGLRFVKSLLKNIQRVDGPPEELSGSAKSPITFERLHPVDVAIPTARASELNRVTLLDFRLHDWKLLGSARNDKGDARIGRVTGQAFGILIAQEPDADKLDEQAALEQMRQASSSVDQRSEPSTHTQSLNAQASTDLAAPSHTAAFDPTEPALATDPPSQAPEPPRPESVREPEVSYTNCWTCEGMPIFLSFVAIWIMCSFKTGMEAGLFMIAICVLDYMVWQRGWKFVRLVPQLLVAALLIFACAVILFFVYAPKEAADCQLVPVQALVAMAVVIVISVLLPWCWIRTLFLAIFLFLVANWCSNDSASCRVDRSNEISVSPFSRLVTQARDRITDFFHSNINSEIVTSEVSGEDVHRISIDEAIRKPEKLKDCRNRVYIPFDFDKSDIDAPTQYKLNRLAQTLRKLGPEKIIVSGYSSFDAGDETPEANLRNIQLSVLRATEVSNSLIRGANIPDKIFESRGLGATEFISRGEGASAINRRVEINLPCERAKQ